MTSHDSAQTITKTGPSYWRSLSEYRGEKEFNEFLDREFPVAASEFPEGVSRRRWMQLMGASLAVAGTAGCRYPVETIEPFVIRPEGRVPGETYQRATNFQLAGRVYHLLINCFDGRPLSIQPNKDHPSGNGTDAYVNASILGLYDPDRSRGDDGYLIRKGTERREPAGWGEFFADFGAERIDELAGKQGGAGFALLLSPTSSPSVVRMLKKVKAKLPNATIGRFDGVDGDAMRDATTKVFGKPAVQSLSLDEADVIVSLQADFLGTDKEMTHAAPSFSKRRDPLDGEMNRLYAVEGGYTTTGAAADSRLALRPSQMPAFLARLARLVDELKSGEEHDHITEREPFDTLSPEDRLTRFIDVVAHDIAEAGDRAVVVVGDALGADAIAAGIQMNHDLGSLGKAQKFTPAVDGDLETVALATLLDKMNGGDVDTLLILGDNPVASSPGDLDFKTALGKVANTIYLGEYDDETGFLCDWSLPLAHPLESWGDSIDALGIFGVCQPQILPLLGGRTFVEVLASMLGEQETEGSAIVRRTADEIAGSSLSTRQWRQLLHDGYAEGLAAGSGALSPSGGGEELTSDTPKADQEIDTNDFEVIFCVGDGVYDGRFANNGWLQEMPQTLTKMTWDNAAIMSPRTARALGVKHGLKVALGDEAVELPVYEIPGCAPGVVSVAIGYGRTRAGMVGGYREEGIDIVGTDVSPIRHDGAMQVAYNVKARPRFQEYEVATTQDHWAIDERGREETETRSFTLVREGTTELLKKIPEFAESKGPHVPVIKPHGSMWNEPIEMIEQENKAKENDTPQWGMSVDLSKCTGCNSCVIACQSENNVPIVGREQVTNSREMHWLRIDRYFQIGDNEDNADVVQQPMACVHCETAPCEQVCPVAATVHTNEGINAMAYNRCIGTRYCANNCPFKVRRFNYFNYNKDIGVGYGVDAFPGTIESANRKLQALVMNPDVTVRGRGVMEKCTYCIQRVEKAKITAIKEDRSIRDGDVVTACQAACPSSAIEFGNIADPNSTVSKKRADVRSYGMLSQLNVKPRTEYLARVRNPHERLMTAAQLHDLANLKEPHGDDHGTQQHGHDHDGGNVDHGAASHETEAHGDDETAHDEHAAEATH